MANFTNSFLECFVPKNNPNEKKASFVTEDNRASGKLKAKKVIVKNSNSLNMRPLHGMANVKRTKSGYKIQAFAGFSAKTIMKTLKAFNDIEIQYSSALDDNDQIIKSKKPLWKLIKGENGVFALTKEAPVKKA